MNNRRRAIFSPARNPVTALSRLAAFALSLLSFLPLRAEQLQIRYGHVPRAVESLRPIAAVEGNRRLQLTIGLPLRNREALTNLLEQLYDPASPLYHQFLTAPQFAERFAPTAQAYQDVIAFAKSNHFVITASHANRLLLDVNAVAGDVERALHIRLNVYRHPTEARKFYSPDREPSLDSRIPILSIAGLDDFFLPHPMDFNARFKQSVASLDSASGQPALNATGSGPAGNFLGRDFRNAYAPGVLLEGSGQSIGLLELDSYYPNDITEYERVAGLPHVPLINVPVAGFNRSPGLNNGEVALDIQMAISMAPGLSNVIVYQGTSANDVLNRMATDNLARQLSSSWSFGQSTDPTREQILQQFAAQGQCFFQASGDGGAYGTTPFPPADDPFVTAVGGTSLITSNNAWASESAWANSGGGISANYAIPAWQRAISTAANLGSTTMRNVPDVAALADATIWVIANNGEQGTVGGTSAAAPLWAGFAALVNQRAAANHQAPIGFINPALYSIGQSPAYASSFHDVTSGANTNPASPSHFFAVSGYDLCTGWGTPTGSNLVNALLAPPDALQITPGSDAFFTGPIGGPFNPLSQTYALANTGPNSISWNIGSTPVWLSTSSTNGVLAPASAPALVTLSLNSAAANLSAGSFVRNVWFTNLNDGFAQRRSVTLAIVTPPRITNQPASQSLPIGATAQFGVGTASNAFLSFQWQSNGTNLTDGANISGAQTSTLELLNVTPANNATYSVTISNAAGVVNSSGATLLVTSAPPVIVSQPAEQTVLPGANTALSVVAYGDPPLSYQWRADGTNLVDSGHLYGSHSNLLTLLSASSADALTYSLIVSNQFGVSTSALALLSVVATTTPELRHDIVYNFTGAADGGHPTGLFLGRDGILLGATRSGGSNDSGTLFQFGTNNPPQTLFSFSGFSDGEMPNGDLLQNPDGTLFGTTFSGGTNGFGTIFQFTTNQLLTTLFAFDHTNGVLPTAGLTQAADGSLFGSAYEGGIFHYGALFRLDTNGAFSVQVPFTSTNGAFPYSKLLLASDGYFYGTTYKGGLFGKGTVFKVSPDGLFTTLASFNGTNGAFPKAALTQAVDGGFYGATTAGGDFGLGTIFQITAAGALNKVYSFSGAADGSHPVATLSLSSDGNFYGTTSDGGTYGAGTVFRFSPDNVLTTISEFDGFNGANPGTPLVEASDFNLYGVTEPGGQNDQGVIFRLSVPGSAPQITSTPSSIVAYAGATAQFSVASFGTPPLSYQWQLNGTNLSDGANFSGSRNRLLVITNITVADVASYRVIITNQFGAVTSTPASLDVFVSSPFFAVQPTNQMLVPGATAVLNAVVFGNVPLTYQWQKDGANVTEAANVFGSRTPTLTITNATETNNGTYVLLVSNALGSIQSSNAVLTIIPVSAPATTLSTLYSFTGAFYGRSPSELVIGNDGFLYGTTASGGALRKGAIFRLSTNGVFSSLWSFDGTNGAGPAAGLVLSTNGLFYGTTTAGGALAGGTAFSFSSTGQLTTLHHFSGDADGAAPQIKLVQAADGNFYGSSSTGGQNGWGTIFQLSPTGAVTTLHSFNGGTDGTGLAGALLAAPSGELYGLTSDGGAFTNGNLFRLSLTGSISSVYSFTGASDGYKPVGGLVFGDDRSLYGATEFNRIRGFDFYGTLFKLNEAGPLNTLYSLNFTDGSYPAAGLLLANDGNFYGTTQQGGANDYGTVFRMTPSGQVTTLVEFDGFNDGANPLTALTQGADGHLYGTTSTGSWGGFGSVFRLGFTGPPAITVQPINQAGSTGGNARFSVAVTGAQPLFFQWQKNGTNITDTAIINGSSARVLNLTALALSDAGKYSVIVTNAAGSVVSTSAALTVQVSPPKFSSVAKTNGALVLTWNTASNRAYQLQSTVSLPSVNWVAVGLPITATSDSLSVSVPIGLGSPGFYRVVLLP